MNSPVRDHSGMLQNYVGITGSHRYMLKYFLKYSGREHFQSLTESFVRFSMKEQTFFAKRLSFLVKANVPLVECLRLIRSQTKSAGKLRVFDAVIADVENGQYLSTSLGKHSRLFGDFAVGLIWVGEHSGILSQNLAYLADELQKKSNLRRKIVGALVYPMIITIATLGVTGALTAFIFPKLMPIFMSLHVDLPPMTQALIAISAYLRAWGILTVIGAIALVVLFLILRRRYIWLRAQSDRWVLNVPLVGSMVCAYNLANFCRTLGLLLRSGITVTEAMAITAETTQNLVYRDAALLCAKGVMEGDLLSRGLAARHDLYPDILVQMVAIGEATGNLSQTLTYLSELYETDVEELTKGLSTAIEPVLMIVMGLLVGLIAVSVIMPIYEISQHLQQK